MIRASLSLLLISVLCGVLAAQTKVQKVEPVDFSRVTVTDAFWQPRMQKVATATIPACILYTESKTGRIRNFEKAARRQGEKHEGIFYDDSDVFKAIEAIAYSLKNHPDADLEKKADEWIAKIAGAQQPDGYLNTFYTLTGLEKRWTDMSMHEMYCSGHLMEAAVAYYATTGKRTLLDVATRYANHIDSVFGPGKRDWVPGHEEVELALVKLYRATSDERFLKLSQWLLEERGRGLGKGYTWNNKDWGGVNYVQDNVPVRDISHIVGHAVRAMYLYSGMADVAALMNDTGYVRALERVSEHVTDRNMYLTGGIGPSGHNEGFTEDYDLPNLSAYCETCASVGMVFWNSRMNRLTGESKYVDILERSLYNGALDGLSLSGDRFFYENPLASDGTHKRAEWFGTACCPSNIARLVSSVGGYIYGRASDGIYVNLFVSSTTTLPLAGTDVKVSMATNYPWDGDVTIALHPKSQAKFNILVRIPGWAQNKPVPGSLYRFLDASDAQWALRVNGKPASYTMNKGYAVVERTWKEGDSITLALPMPVRRVVSIDSVKANRNRVAIQRGPLVYCIENVDNNGYVNSAILPDNVSVAPEFRKDLLNGVVVLQADVPVVAASAGGQSVSMTTKRLTAIPYYAWCNRGSGEMQVWLPNKAVRFQVVTD